MATTADVRVRPLDVDAWPALAGLFEEGGDPKWCWCMYWRKRGVDFSSSSAASNREGLNALVGREPAAGLIALEPDGRAVGWVSLAPRSDFERLERSRVRRRLDAVPVWSIVCFVVARRARRSGLQARLLEAAIEHARAHGAPALEAYPVDTAGNRVAAANLYTGTLSTFLRAGFHVAAEVASPGSTVRRVIVRLDLTIPRPSGRDAADEAARGAFDEVARDLRGAARGASGGAS